MTSHGRLATMLALCALPGTSPLRAQRGTEPAREIRPLAYVVQRTPAPLRIDGLLDEPAWTRSAWTADFVDIEGESQPRPALRTRARMLWDDDYLYIAAELEEPHLWGTLTQRDAVIFQDNDFEVFIDPDGDTHEYFELEINALGTAWDLLLTRPYRDDGRALNGWDLHGMLSAVHRAGTINDPADRDTSWTLELALPWSALREAAVEGRAPRPGEQWRINFSRVEWDVGVAGSSYRKRVDAAGKPLPEHNWVWSPQGEINMHMPEQWGRIQFSGTAAGEAAEAVRADPDERVEAGLRALYYAQRRFFRGHGRYAESLRELGNGEPAPGTDLRPTASGYEITAQGADGRLLHITHDGRQWRTAGAGR